MRCREDIFTPINELSKEVAAAAKVSGEKLWRMPMEESYWESMKSGEADMVNTGGRQVGSITTALFLKQFVNEKLQSLHIQMAGPVWNDKKKAATGFAISTYGGMVCVQLLIILKNSIIVVHTC